MRTSREFYAPELKRDIKVAALSAPGVLAVNNVQESRMPQNAKNMALVLEHMRDGLLEPPIRTNDELMEFARKYPDLTARIFLMIRRLTASLDT